MATPVNTSDSSALKKALDDGVANILLSHLDFKENVWWTTRRLGLMTATALAGCAAQFAPIPLPAGRWLLGGLVLVFFIFNGLLNFMNYYVDRDYIFLTKANKTGGFPALKFRSLLPKYSDMYTLVIEDMDSRKLASFEASVGKYFTKAGDFADGYLKVDLEAALNSINAGTASKGTPKPEKRKH